MPVTLSLLPYVKQGSVYPLHKVARSRKDDDEGEWPAGGGWGRRKEEGARHMVDGEFCILLRERGK